LYTVLFSIKLSLYFAPANGSTQVSVALIYTYDGQLLLIAYCRDNIMFLTVRPYCDTCCVMRITELIMLVYVISLSVKMTSSMQV